MVVPLGLLDSWSKAEICQCSLFDLGGPASLALKELFDEIFDEAFAYVEARICCLYRTLCPSIFSVAHMVCRFLTCYIPPTIYHASYTICSMPYIYPPTPAGAAPRSSVHVCSPLSTTRPLPFLQIAIGPRLPHPFYCSGISHPLPALDGPTRQSSVPQAVLGCSTLSI